MISLGIVHACSVVAKIAGARRAMTARMRPMSDPLFVSRVLTVPAAELRFTSVRASGPGGQNVNKVASKVELRFDFERSKVLADELKSRLRVLARGRLDAEGRILIVRQVT